MSTHSSLVLSRPPSSLLQAQVLQEGCVASPRPSSLTRTSTGSSKSILMLLPNLHIDNGMPQLSMDSGTHWPLLLSKNLPSCSHPFQSAFQIHRISNSSTTQPPASSPTATVGMEDATRNALFFLPGLYFLSWGFFSACLEVLGSHEPWLCLPWKLLSQTSQGACDSQNPMCLS